MKARKIRVMAAVMAAALAVTATVPAFAGVQSSGYETEEKVSPAEAAEILKGYYPDLDLTDRFEVQDKAMCVAQTCVWLYHDAIPNAPTPEIKAGYEAWYQETCYIIELLNIVLCSL